MGLDLDVDRSIGQFVVGFSRDSRLLAKTGCRTVFMRTDEHAQLVVISAPKRRRLPMEEESTYVVIEAL